MILVTNTVTVAQMMGVRLSHVETPKAEEWTPSPSLEWAKHMEDMIQRVSK